MADEAVVLSENFKKAVENCMRQLVPEFTEMIASAIAQRFGQGVSAPTSTSNQHYRHQNGESETDGSDTDGEDASASDALRVICEHQEANSLQVGTVAVNLTSQGRKRAMDETSSFASSAKIQRTKAGPAQFKIRQLQIETKELEKQLVTVTAEKDAAIEALKSVVLIAQEEMQKIDTQVEIMSRYASRTEAVANTMPEVRPSETRCTDHEIPVHSGFDTEESTPAQQVYTTRAGRKTRKPVPYEL